MFLNAARPSSVARRNGSDQKMAAPRNDNNAVSFIIAMNSLPVGGMMTRSACGSTMRRIFCRYVIPNASAASDWPWETDWIPARKISVMYAP